MSDLKEAMITAFALGFCVMTGAAGYHQVQLVNARDAQALKNHTHPAVYLSVDDTLETIDKLDLQVPEDVKIICAKYGNEYGIEPELLEAIAWRESRFVSNVTSENGRCKGLMQIDDTTHKERMDKLGVSDIYDSESNVRVAADYLAELLEDNPNIDYALARYHGESRPEKVLNGAKPSNYVRQIRRVADVLTKMRKEV